jgi:glycerate kinase
MRILVAPDKFKSSLTASEAAEVIAEGMQSVIPHADIDIQPLADGGEGTMRVICDALGGVVIPCPAHDPLGREILAGFGWVKKSHLAVIEAAEASGYWRVASQDRAPWVSSTIGTGELILAAIQHGASKILVGLGGSATNDAGVGMAAALGFQFFDDKGNLIRPVPSEFFAIRNVIRPPCQFSVAFEALSDVTNPLTGPRGATRIFGPQKGVIPEDVDRLDAAVAHLALIVERDLGVTAVDAPGSGAAGGLGFGLVAFCGATMTSGFDVIASLTDLEARVTACDLVVTAEGSLDHQTLDGKGPGALAVMGRRFGKRVVAIGGRIADEEALLGTFDRVMPLSPVPLPLDESISRAAELLGIAARRLAMLEALNQ